MRITIKQAHGQIHCFLFFISLLFSCSPEDRYVDNEEDERVMVRFGAAVGDISLPDIPDTDNNAGTRTIAEKEVWKINDSIGIFMLAENAIAIENNILNGSDNLQYKAKNDQSSVSEFLPASSNEVIYYPQDVSKVKFIAYYPYRATPDTDSYIYKVDISDQSEQSAIDFLYSNNVTGYAENDGVVNLKFKHKLCRIVLNLHIGNSGMTYAEFSGLQSSDVVFSNLNVRAKIDLATGTITPSNYPQLFSPLKTEPPAGVDLQFVAIVIPENVGSGCKIMFDFKKVGETYEFVIPSGTQFKSGEQVTYELTFKSKTRSSAVRSVIGEAEEVQIDEIRREVWH